MLFVIRESWSVVRKGCCSGEPHFIWAHSAFYRLLSFVVIVLREGGGSVEPQFLYGDFAQTGGFVFLKVIIKKRRPMRGVFSCFWRAIVIEQRITKNENPEWERPLIRQLPQSLLQFCGAVRAAGSIISNDFFAVGAFSRFFGRCFREEVVDLLDAEENCKCDDEEVDDVIDEGAISNDRYACFFRFR